MSSNDDRFSLVQQVRSSVVRVPGPDTPRNRVLRITNSVWLHIHPSKVKRHGTRLSYTWGAGGLSFLLFIITIVTGVLLMFVYRPTVEHAYLDVKALDFEVRFGMFNRNLHRWSAHLMVLMVWIHMLRVFLTGAYKGRRRFNWVLGVGLLTLTMLLSFTGYLLPWDQLSIWAVTVGTNMAAAAPLVGHEGPFSSMTGVTETSDLRALLLGDSVVGSAALLRFYVLHCIFLPLLLMFGCILHFWRVRTDGGISSPRDDADDVVPRVAQARDADR